MIAHKHKMSETIKQSPYTSSSISHPLMTHAPMSTVETWAQNNAVAANMLKAQTVEVMVCQSILTTMECHMQSSCAICQRDNRAVCTHDDNRKDSFYNSCMDKATTNIQELNLKSPFLQPNPRVALFSSDQANNLQNNVYNSRVYSTQNGLYLGGHGGMTNTASAGDAYYNPSVGQDSWYHPSSYSYHNGNYGTYTVPANYSKVATVVDSLSADAKSVAQTKFAVADLQKTAEVIAPAQDPVEVKRDATGLGAQPPFTAGATGQNLFNGGVIAPPQVTEQNLGAKKVAQLIAAWPTTKADANGYDGNKHKALASNEPVHVNVGSSQNSFLNKDSFATTWGLANPGSSGQNAAMVMNHPGHQRSPSLVWKLPPGLPIIPAGVGPYELAEENKTSSTDYYDGRTNLNLTPNCTILLTPRACSARLSCSWCSGQSSCIGLNHLGAPSMDCGRQVYQYQGAVGWQPKMVLA